MTYTTWLTVPLSEIFTFARQTLSDAEEIERRDFFVEWLKNHFKVAGLTAAQQALESLPQAERILQENLLRIEYAYCQSEPLTTLRRLRDGGKLEDYE